MDKVAGLAAAERNELFTQTAANLGITPAIVEKDFWVSWVLKKLFEHDALARKLTFKGGTSLSKVYGLIERFSEDIDLVLDWQCVTPEEPFAPRSKNQQDKFNKATMAALEAYTGGTLLPEFQALLAPTAQCELNADNHKRIDVTYPAAFRDDYLRPQVVLEFSALAATSPAETRQVTCRAARAFPKLFDTPECGVRVISAQRSFWEKATILHNETCRPASRPQEKGYSRHYYDLALLAKSDIGREALNDAALLANVVAYKQLFYPNGWSRYDLAVPGTFRLVPTGHVLEAVQRDYADMRNMFFGRPHSLAAILEDLQELENAINQLNLPGPPNLP